jgi:predicted metalloprotease with PDZ domain
MRRYYPASYLKGILLFWITLSGVQFMLANQAIKPDSYTIHIDGDDPHRALVECTLQVHDSLLFMSPVGANQFPSRWAEFIHNLKAENIKGQAVQLDSLEGARWKIGMKDGSKVKLTYEVHLDHEKYKWSGGIDGAAYQRDWGVFYTSRSLFIMSGENMNNIEVRFEIPAQWKVSTPWDRITETAPVFLVKNQTSLSDGMFFAGTHEEYTVKRDDFELLFVMGGDEIIGQKEIFKQMAKGVLDYYIELMGGIPNPDPDNQFNRCIVIMNSGPQTDGEVIGNNISILLQEKGDAMSQLVARFIFAHEFFHLWNGKSFAPVNNDCEWFKEGITNYYTLKSLHHIGYLDDDYFLQVLNNFFYQRYDKDKGVGQLSMTQGDQKHEHWGLIYSGGLFAGISQDMIIRSYTENRNNLDNIMKFLFNKYGGTREGYTLDELYQLMSEASGKDQTEFFKTYIRGTERIPVSEYLNLGGFKASESEGRLSIDIKEDPTRLDVGITEGFFGK